MATVSTAALASSGKHLGARATVRPERLPSGMHPDQARPQPARPGAALRFAAHRLDGSTGFLIHQLLADAPELDPPLPSRGTTHAAYQAHLARRIRYSGPVTSIDLRV